VMGSRPVVSSAFLTSAVIGGSETGSLNFLETSSARLVSGMESSMVIRF
jgi:hypothetical protein